MLVRATISVRSATPYVADSFENCVINVAIDSSLLDVCVIYRPPPNTRNKITTKQFIADFYSMLEEYVTSTGHVVHLGDFNFHLDKENDPQAQQFNDLLYSLNFAQHVKSPTHCAGHILDCVKSPSDLNDLVVSSDSL